MDIKKYAVIEKGKVVNMVVSESALESNWILSDTAKIGDSYDGSQFITPDLPITVPDQITRFQFKSQLSTDQKLSAFNTWLSSLPESDSSLLYFNDSFTFKRSSSSIEIVRAALNMTNDEMDTLFVDASQL